MRTVDAEQLARKCQMQRGENGPTGIGKVSNDDASACHSARLMLPRYKAAPSSPWHSITTVATVSCMAVGDFDQLLAVLDRPTFPLHIQSGFLLAAEVRTLA